MQGTQETDITVSSGLTWKLSNNLQGVNAKQIIGWSFMDPGVELDGFLTTWDIL